MFEAEILIGIAASCGIALDEPEPLFLIDEFADSGINILFAVWFEKTDFLALKNEMMLKIKAEFKKKNVVIPYPHRTIQFDSETLPVRVR